MASPGASPTALLTAAALAALGASCDNLSPKVSGISSHDPGSGPIVIGDDLAAAIASTAGSTRCTA
jgi:hypothetical protein